MVTHSHLAVTPPSLQTQELTVHSLLVLFNGEDVMAVVFLWSSSDNSLFLVVVCHILVVPRHWHWVWSCWIVRVIPIFLSHLEVSPVRINLVEREVVHVKYQLLVVLV